MTSTIFPTLISSLTGLFGGISGTSGAFGAACFGAFSFFSFFFASPCCSGFFFSLGEALAEGCLDLDSAVVAAVAPVAAGVSIGASNSNGIYSNTPVAFTGG